MSQQNYQHRLVRKFSQVALIAIVITGVGGTLSAAAASQSFNVLDNKSQPGMLMSLTANSGVVEPATDKNASLLLGVISANDTAFDLQPGQVSVATDGVANVLVSTLGGDIRVGDRITPSSLAGIGAKAKMTAWIVGIAQASLDSKTTAAVASTVTDTAGSKHQVYVARIPLVVHVTYYTVREPGAEIDPRYAASRRRRHCRQARFRFGAGAQLLANVNRSYLGRYLDKRCHQGRHMRRSPVSHCRKPLFAVRW